MALEFKQAWGGSGDEYGNIVGGNPAGTYTDTGSFLGAGDYTKPFESREAGMAALLDAAAPIGGGIYRPEVLSQILQGNEWFGQTGITDADLPGIQTEAQKRVQEQLGRNKSESKGGLADWIMPAVIAFATGGIGAAGAGVDIASAAGAMGGAAGPSFGGLTLADVAGGGLASGSGFAGSDAIETLINLTNETGLPASEAAKQLGFNSVEELLGSVNSNWVNSAGSVLNNPKLPMQGMEGVASSPQNMLQRIFSQLAGGNSQPLVGDLMGNINAQAAAELSGGAPAFGQVSLPGAIGETAFAPEDMWKKLMARLAGGNIFQPGGGMLSTISSIGSGLYGMYKAGQIPKMIESAANRNDPFGRYRDGYAQQLAALSANPGSVTGIPGYQFGIDQGNQALMRTMASRGLTGSGNEAIALQKYNQDYAGRYLAAEQARLAQLAGAGIGGNTGSLTLTGTNMANDLMSKALASIGYGLRGS